MLESRTRPRHPPSAFLIYSQKRREELSGLKVKVQDSFQIVKREWKEMEDKSWVQAVARAIYRKYKLLQEEWEDLKAEAS